jgi:uncharacterized UPF0160 family protein
MKKIVTHGTSRFHTDDVFAVAILDLLNNGDIEVTRMGRIPDEVVLKGADYVVDYSWQYDAEKDIFDHHQEGGAGARENGIQYASAGLVWEKYGEALCGSAEVAHIIDEILIAPIDGGDNGQDLFTLIGETRPYLLQDVISLYRNEEDDAEKDKAAFMQAEELAKFILQKEIAKAQTYVKAKKEAIVAYENAADKRLVIFDDPTYSSGNLLFALSEFPEPLFIVFPDGEYGGSWRVKALRKGEASFESRKDLPASWGGLLDEELQKASGVADALFCHRGLFTCGAKSKEGALQMAQKALETNN